MRGRRAVDLRGHLHPALLVVLAVQLLLAAAIEAGALARYVQDGRHLHQVFATAGVAAAVLTAVALTVLRRRSTDVHPPDPPAERAAASALAEHSHVAARYRVTQVLSGPKLPMALQPIVHLGTGRLAGVEALARFPDGRCPDDWFDDAHATGLALQLDRLAFTSALQLMPRLPPYCHLSINASPELITEGTLMREVARAEIAHSRLVIEVTEHVKIGNYPDLLAALAEVRERGVRLAIDDTGAGYASFSHVLQLRPDIIKVDRSLITTLATDPARRSLITALVLLALDLDASVTAEGVASPQELETLASLGVDCAQGYLLARPTAHSQHWQRWFERNWLYPAGSDTPGRLREMARLS